MPIDPETASHLASTDTKSLVGGGGGVLALGYAVFDWIKKSGTTKGIRADIETLKNGFNDQKVSLAELKGQIATKADFAGLVEAIHKSSKGDFEYLNNRIDTILKKD